MLPALARQFAADTAVPDADLLDRFARAADPAAFELLVWRHGAMVWAACRRVLGADAAAAEDASQAAFAALARHAGRVRAVGPWLHRVAVRASLDLLAAGRGRRELPAALPDPHPGPDRVAADRESRAAIDAAVNDLPEKLRAAFVLCELEGRSNAEAAAALGCPVGTVESRLTRARQRLRRRLTAGGLAPAVLPVAVRAALLRPPTAAVRALAARAAGGGSGALRLVVAVGLVLGAVGFSLSAPEPPPAPAVLLPAATADPPAAAKVVARFGAPGMRHAGAVTDVAFAPDGKRLASVGTDNTIRVWNAETGTAVFAVAWAGGTPERVRFTADGKELRAVGHAPGRGGEVWHINPAGAVTKKLPVPVAGGGPFDARFSDDAKLLALHTPGDRTVAVADAATGKAVWDYELPRGDSPTAVAFSRDNQLLLVGSRGGAVMTIDAGTGGNPKTLYGPVAPVSAVALSPSTRTVVAAFGKAGITAWTRATGEWKWGSSARGDGGLVFSRDGKLLFRAAVGAHASTIDPDDGRLPNTCGVLGTFFDGMMQASCVALHTAPHYHGDDRVAFGTAGGAVVVYWITEKPGRPTEASPEPAGAPERLGFTPDGKTLRGWAGDWFAWDVATGKQTRLTTAGWNRSPLSPDGRYTAQQTESSWLRDRNDPHDGVRLVFSTPATGRPEVFLAGTRYRAAWLDFTPDGALLGATPDGTLKVWEAPTGEERFALAGHAAPPRAHAFSRDAKTLATADADGVRVWSLTAAKELARFDGAADRVAVSGDGSRVAATTEGRVLVWDVAGAKQVARVEVAAGLLALNADGSRLATAVGGEVRVWSADGAERARLTHAGTVTGLTFAPDGRTLAAATNDVPVTLWALD